jgi:hypothetical protein
MKKSVTVQKGPIIADSTRSKVSDRQQILEEDRENARLRKSGQTLTLHTPSKWKR